MKKIVLATVCAVLAIGSIAPAHAQKEAIGMFYEMQMAPKVCNWTGVADGKKLAATIADMEKGLGISSSEKATMMKQAETELKSDPSNCDPNGMLRPMYDEAVK